jgi:hypothetical protein
VQRSSEKLDREREAEGHDSFALGKEAADHLHSNVGLCYSHHRTQDAR